jgi:glycerol-3-phosphate dehydrogenase
LIDTYGIRYQDVLKIAEGSAPLREPIVPGQPSIKAQIVYALQVEMAQNEEDILQRRLGLIYDDCDLKRCREEVKKYLGKTVTF